ncbi:MAG: hypothetical protein ACXVLQ_12710 [Bacteriovorax sp.]
MSKTMNSLLALLALQINAAYALDQAITIDRTDPTDYVADDYHPSSRDLYLTGSGFFPSDRYQDWSGKNKDVQHAVQVTYRQVYPTLGNVQVVPIGRKGQNAGGIWVASIGPNDIDISMLELVTSKYANTAWSFSVCSVGVGCSNAVTIHIRGPGAPDVSIATGSNPIDIAAGSGNRAIQLNVKGLTTPSPILKIGSNSIWGNYDGSIARFVLPSYLTAAPNYYSAFIDDTMTASDSEQFGIRVFGVPAPQLSSDLAISQSLMVNQPIQDASFVIPMSPMTSPTTVIWQDGANNTALNVPLDLLTNKARITIPGSALRLGKYTGNLRLINIAGEKIVPVNVEIGQIIYKPIPNPNPIPRPPMPRPFSK